MNPPNSPIPQPPHSAGLAFKGLRAAIDPQSIPSPIDAIEEDREKWEDQPYGTLPGGQAPLSTTDYVAIDQGNSSPKYIRVSTWNIPSTSRLASDCEIPIVAVIQPFADQDPREEPVPLVETGDLGPARCANCRGYINPWCKWVSNGERWKCNLCAHETEVAPEYYCNLDANLARLDHLQRPELNKGTVDFVVPDEYWAPHPPPKIAPLYLPLVPLSNSGNRQPQPMSYVFAFDVSLEAFQSGFTQAACTFLLEFLYGRETEDGQKIEPCFPADCKICIISFDRTIHFYNLSPQEADNAPMLVLPDVDDVFVPLRDGLFADPRESQRIITDLLSNMANLETHVPEPDAALGSALTACLGALTGLGGQVVLFAGVIPTTGIGALQPVVDESTLFGTDKEKTLFVPRGGFWRDLAVQCTEEGIGVNMFLGMSRPIDIASIGIVSSITGGELYFHPRFDPTRDNVVMHSQFRRLLTRVTGYSCSMRVRCSTGVHVTQQYGNFYESPLGDLESGTLDADKAISVVIEHNKALEDTAFAFIQSAVLYTTVSGQRRVRVCNLALQVASLAGNVFRYADLDAVACHMLREAIAKLPNRTIANIHEQLTEKCVSILLGYRKHCAASAPPSQLILPEALKVLPLYTLAVMKTKPLKGRNVNADVRNYQAHKLMAMGVRSTMNHLYPRLLALHDLTDAIALPEPTIGRIRLPSLMRDSYIFMQSYGVYLIDNEEMMVLWIGSDASPQLLKDLLAVEDFFQINSHITCVPSLQTRLSTQVRNILANRYTQRGWTPKFMIARRDMDAAEIEFSDMLVEDQNNAAMSYLDYLCLVHKQINTALTGGSVSTNHSSFKATPW
ncbi:sec24-like protein [Laetiporus sulphureus 93-53]|uniref:Sec24-like protein n=1 Tax=Laetiporus sulphureus 93-53 TaxID=1314785 RepID=A0A165CKK8_9APHY|nr:sec24-like protein [Laetiporus sulphureus 93-53]KZT02981.1 sec24-like protein [Laetiporus sulphureus 93-53]